LGVALSGKTTLATSLKGKYAAEVFKWEEAIEALKVKLSTEEN